jgi:hypothetical protein
MFNEDSPCMREYDVPIKVFFEVASVYIDFDLIVIPDDGNVMA